MRPLPDVSIRQLEYLVAVADEDTWALAARRVGVSPSALSQGLAELERRLGLTLFDRDGRRRTVRVGATPVVDHARHVLALTGDLSDWATRVRHGTAGRLRLGMIDAAAVVHFPDVVRAFRVERPDVELHLRVAPSAALVDALVGGELDLVVCVDPPAAVANIDCTELMSETLSVYGPPDGATDDTARWGPWVMFPAGSHTRVVVEEHLARLGARVEVVAESHQPDVLREMVRLGTGWTVLPESQAEHGDRPLRDGTPLATRRLVVAVRSGSVHDPAVDDLAARLHDARRPAPSGRA